jgi:hypothetical protein
VTGLSADGGKWSGVTTVRPGDDGTRADARQDVARPNVGGVATLDLAGTTPASFWFLVVVDGADGVQRVLSVTPADSRCTPLAPVSGSTYAAQWALSAENGAPATATGGACVTLAGATDVTISLVTCVPPKVELETSARRGRQRNTVSPTRLRLLGWTAPARAAALLRLEPVVVAATVSGDGAATALSVDGRPLAPCSGTQGQIAVVWELTGAHSFDARATSPAGTAAGTARLTATTALLGRPTSTDRAALARLAAALDGKAAPRSFCPHPGA